ncbi:hypothetical protein BELL_0087g00180 [Botrytis elliptica]|uniref:Uncharacterized protein n=1 Tax=Botrytis elliptica TaxID=278938 RepID=A0A4Z1K9C8_9HELO|nr:hypothetical protein BELL_0087g00180 [Botrytis elliptica]
MSTSYTNTKYTCGHVVEKEAATRQASEEPSQELKRSLTRALTGKVKKGLKRALTLGAAKPTMRYSRLKCPACAREVTATFKSDKYVGWVDELPIQAETAPNPRNPISKLATTMRSSDKKSYRKNNSHLWRPPVTGVANKLVFSSGLSTKKPSVAKLPNRIKIERTHSLLSKDVLASNTAPPCPSGGTGIPRRRVRDPNSKSSTSSATFLPTPRPSEIRDRGRKLKWINSEGLGSLNSVEHRLAEDVLFNTDHQTAMPNEIDKCRFIQHTIRYSERVLSD